MRILYEDDALIAVEKDPALVSEFVTGEGDSLPARILKETGLTGLYPVHRLDKGTGGVIVYAKTQRSATLLIGAIAAHKLKKTYLCVVSNTPEAPEGELRDFLYHDSRQNKTFAVRSGRRGAKEAVLCYRILGTAESEAGVLSLLSIELLTGRTHQIRAQFASRKMPVYGDRRYGSPGKMPGGVFALWSASLSFSHPLTQKTLSLTSDPPEEAPWSLFRTEILNFRGKLSNCES